MQLTAILCRYDKFLQRYQIQKILKVMKLTAIFLLTVCITASAKTYSQKINLHERNSSLEKIFKKIERQSDYTFIYKDDILQSASKINVDLQNVDVLDALDFCLAKQPLTYSVVEKTIVIKTKNPPVPYEQNLLQYFFPPPPIDVKGRVVDASGQPVLATISVKGSNRGTRTDENGQFSLPGVDEKSTLIITSVNIETMEIKLMGKAELGSITVKTKVTEMLGVVINKGYYSTSKELNTGNVSRVSAASIEKQPVTNPLQALQGRVPGIQITQLTGNPGGGYSVLIRGRNNLRSGADYPLYVVDGVPYSSNPIHSELGDLITQGGNPLNLINPLDIESMEVLKDADATSIYGSRGANGVILITTKKGKAGNTKFNVNFYSGFGQVAGKVKLLSTPQYLEMRNEAIVNSGQPIGRTDYDLDGTWDKNRYTDWQEVLLGGSSEIYNAQFAISGGTNKTQFYFGGGYSSEGTVLPASFGNKKGSAHFNLSHGSENGKFNAQISATFMNDRNNIYSYDMTSTALQLPPNAPELYTGDGKLNWQTDTWTNPLANLKETYKVISNTLIGSTKLTYKIIPSLLMGVSAGYTLTDLNETHLMPLSSLPPVFGYTSGESDYASNEIKTWIVEPQAEYSMKLAGGKLTALAGMTFQGSNNQKLSFHASGFSNDKLLENIQAASSIITTNYLNNFYKYQAFYGRLNYDYKQKYLINITGRRDGSSRFGPGKQFGNFGAIGGAWILSNEHFFQKIPEISFAKIRGSYGTTGSDQTQDYVFLDLWNSTTYPYNGSQGLYPRSLYNPDLAWTLNRKLEIALEVGVFKNRLFLSSSFYKHTTPNQLISLALPSTTGFSLILGNFPAVVENKGFEIELSSVNISKTSFRWTSNFNITIPKNTLLDFPGIENSSYATQYQVGRSLYTQNRFHYTGVDPTTGIATYDDINHDGVITITDRAFMKEVAQQFYAGLENNIRYKGFELNFLWNYVEQTALGYRNYFFTPPGFKMNQPSIVMNRWQKPGDITDIQKFTPVSNAAYTAYTRSADNKIVDASYLRLKSLRLAYQLPEKLIQKLTLQQCNFFLQGQNLLTVTNYIGLDPEIYQGLYQSYYLPPLRVITAGIQINF